MRRLATLLLLSLPLFAQNAALQTDPNPPFLDNNGKPVAGGKLYTCSAGTTCPGNPLATYTDITAGTPNANPVILDSTGRAAVYIGSSSYKFVLQNSLGVQIWVRDNVSSMLLFGNLAGTQAIAQITSKLGAANGYARLDASAFVPQNELNYIQGGTGSVNRQVQDRLRDTVTVKDFGAVGDGSHDDTAAIQAAITAVASGGKVFIPAGTYKITSSITISKTLTLEGAGSGGQNSCSGACDSFNTITKILNTSTSASAIFVQPTAGTWISGLVLRDFAIEGNRDVVGATAGDNILIAGGSTNHVRNTLIENVLTFHAFRNGLTFQDNSYGSTAFHLLSYRNGSNGIAVTATGCSGTTCTGQPSSLDFIDCWVDEAAADAIQISAPNATDINIVGGFYADSTNGLRVTSAAVWVNVAASHSHFENNSNANILLQGGYGHVISDNQIQGDSTTAYGVYVDSATTSSQLSATIRNNSIQHNVTKDIYISAQAKNVQLYPQDRIISNYSITDSGTNTQYLSAGVWGFGPSSPSFGGSVNFDQTAVTQTETVKFPMFGTSSTGTVLFGFSPNTYGIGTTGIGAISSQSVTAGTCVDGGDLNIPGYQVGMGLAVSEIGSPGAWFTLHYGHSDATHFKIKECNASASAQTIGAVSFYVRVIQ